MTSIRTRLLRVALFSAVAVAMACGGAKESDLFATDEGATGADGSAPGVDSGGPGPGKDGAGGKDTAVPTKAPIEIADFDVGKGDRRLFYQVKLRNVSSVEMSVVSSIELAFAGGGGTIFQINCMGQDWRVSPGNTGNVPTFSTFSTSSLSPAQSDLLYECAGVKNNLPIVPAIAKYGQPPVALTLRGAMKDGTEWYVTATRGGF